MHNLCQKRHSTHLEFLHCICIIPCHTLQCILQLFHSDGCLTSLSSLRLVLCVSALLANLKEQLHFLKKEDLKSLERKAHKMRKK